MADSSIVYQNIDEDFPVAGQDNDSQGFRDNFSEIKTALQSAKTELSGLLTNGARLNEDNDFNGKTISNATLIQTSDKVYNTGNISINTVIDWRDGSYQNVTVTAGVVLSLGNWPASGNLGYVRLAIRSDGSPRTVTVIADNAGTVFRSPNWPASNTLTVDSLVNPFLVDAWTSDGGATVFLNYIGQLSTTQSRVLYDGTDELPAVINGRLRVNGVIQADTISGAVVGTVNQLNLIGDVSVPTPANGEVLTWNSAQSAWTAQSIASTSLNGLSDVVLTSSASGQVLMFNGSEWANTSLTERNQINLASNTTGGSGLTLVFADGSGDDKDLSVSGNLTYIPATDTLTVGNVSADVVEATTLKGSVTDSADNVIIDTDGIVTPQKFILPKVTSAQRDSGGYGVEGALVYNTTLDKVQAYQTGEGWINLDGTTPTT